MTIWFVLAEPETMNQFVLKPVFRPLVWTCNDQPIWLLGHDKVMEEPTPAAKVRTGEERFVTVTTEFATKPPSRVVVVMVVVPVALAVTSPVPLTLAMTALLEAQV